MAKKKRKQINSIAVNEKQQPKKKRLTVDQKIERSREKQQNWLDNGDAVTFKSGFVIHTQFGRRSSKRLNSNKPENQWKPSTITDGATAHHGGGPLINTQKRDMEMNKPLQIKKYKRRKNKR